MKKNCFLLLLLFLLFGLASSCSKDDEQVASTDISVMSSKDIIFWIAESDLTQKIDNAITFNFINVSETEIEKSLNFNSDSTKLVSSINFKQEFQSKYYDPNISNNTVEINLQKESDIQIDNNLLNALTGDQQCELLQALINDLPNFNLSSASFLCIPITFHIPSGLNINQPEIDVAINNLNTSFFDSKLSFELNEINTTSNSIYYNLDIDDTNYNEDVINNLNIYVANTLTVNDLPNNLTLNGMAHFPTESIDRIYIRDVFFDSNRDELSAILIHELGHFFSLFHTFETFANNAPCNSNNTLTGDGIVDTPMDDYCPFDGCTQNTIAAFYYGVVCNAINSDIEELIDNFMSYSMNVYTLRNCDRAFTQEQHNRIGFAARQWKQNLNCQISNTESIINLSDDIDFGEVLVNANSPIKTLTISNLGNESFNITNVISSNNIFSILNAQPVTIQPNSNFTLEIQFSPIQEQNYTGNITIENDADNANSSNSSIQVSGTGINNTGNSDLKVEAIWLNDDGNGQYDINVEIRNIGIEPTPSNESLVIKYFIDNQLIGSNTNNPINSNQQIIKSFDNYQFSNSSTYDFKVEIETVSNEVNTSNNILTQSFPISIGGGSGGCSIITDIRDGETYNTIEIGNQCWMAENLRYDAPSSGDLPWQGAGANPDLYGRLYSWNSIMNGAQSSNSQPSGVTGICPDGWHVPSLQEWQTLINNYGQSAAYDILIDGGGSGFNAQLGGSITGNPGGVTDFGLEGFYWTTTYDANSGAFGYRAIKFRPIFGISYINSLDSNTFSCRCVKD